MRFSFAALMLASSIGWAALITDNRVLDLQAGVGYTLNESGSITNWADQSGLTNDAVQVTNVYAPKPYTDPQGRPTVRFLGSVINGLTNVMWVGSGLSVNSRATTVYAVCTGPTERTTGNVFTFTTWASFNFLAFGQTTAYVDPIVMRAPQWQASTNLMPAMNPAVFVAENATVSTNTVLRWNNIEQTNTPAGNATLTGGIIGGHNNRWAGDMYRLIVYSVAHTAAQRQQNVDALAEQYRIITNFTVRVACRGDSITHGQGGTNLSSWPYQMMERLPEIQWYQMGVGSARIQTNGATGNCLYSADPTYLDPLLNSGMTNWLLVKAGVNDLNADAISGQATYGRLTNYCAARKAAGWKVGVITIADNNTSAAQGALYNAAIRTQSQAYWDKVIDPGKNSPVENRLNDSNDDTYFLDGTHLVGAGYSVIADHAATAFNANRRGGFFGQ